MKGDSAHRPGWISASAPAGAQADQFLHAHYYQRTFDGRKANYATFFETNKTRRAEALAEGGGPRRFCNRLCQRNSKRCGRDSIDCWLGGDADLLPLDAQSLHSVFLVGEDLSGKR